MNKGNYEQNEESFKLVGAICQNWLFEHPTYNIKLLVACCIVEIMKCFSPEDPFVYSEMKSSILKMFGELFGGLEVRSDEKICSKLKSKSQNTITIIKFSNLWLCLLHPFSSNDFAIFQL